MSPRTPSLLLAGVALAVYLALGQNAMHGFDAYHFLRNAEAGNLRNPQTLLYPPVAWLWAKALALPGVPLYEALRALSSVAAALGVLGCHAAAVAFGLDRARALMVAAGCAAAPAVLHSASVVEIDALLFACAALAFVPFAHLVRSERWRFAALTGLATLVATAFHAAGHLLAATLCALNLAWGFPRRRPSVTLPPSLLLVAVHGTGTLLIGWLAGSSGQAIQAGNTLALAFHFDFLGHVLLYEWLLPYLPFCLLAPLALRHRDLRAATGAFLICLSGYLVVTTMILGTFRTTGPELPHKDIVERGSFLLGIALPMVWLAVAALPGRWPWLAVAASLAAGIAQVRIHDWPADPEGYAAGYAELAQQEPLQVVVADAEEWAWIARRHPGAPVVLVAELEEQARRAAAGQPVTSEHFSLWFTVTAQQQRELGRTLCVTPLALARMKGSRNAELAKAAAALATTHVLEPMQARGFVALRVKSR